MPLVRRRIRVPRMYRGPLLERGRSMKLLREHAVEAIVSLTFACQHTSPHTHSPSLLINLGPHANMSPHMLIMPTCLVIFPL